MPPYCASKTYPGLLTSTLPGTLNLKGRADTPPCHLASLIKANSPCMDPLTVPLRKYKNALSGKRGSNPRPSAWEADALPTELFPQCSPLSGNANIAILLIFRKSRAESFHKFSRQRPSAYPPPRPRLSSRPTVRRPAVPFQARVWHP